MAKGFIEIPLDEWTEMKERIVRLETMIQQLINFNCAQCQKEVLWIKERLSRGRPSWTVATIIAFLSSATVGLLIAYLKQVGG